MPWLLIALLIHMYRQEKDPLNLPASFSCWRGQFFDIVAYNFAFGASSVGTMRSLMSPAASFR